MAQTAPRRAEGLLAIEARAFDGPDAGSAGRKVGKLLYLGGLELRANHAEFGGISSGAMDADGRGFLLLTDRAHWISGRFVEKDGVLQGVTHGRIAPLRAPNGRNLKTTRWFDSEGLARTGSVAYVSVERVHDILRYDLGAGGFSARPVLVPVPQDMKTLDGNSGIEALGVLPAGSPHAGSLLAIAERAPRRSGQTDIPAFLIGGKAPLRLTVVRRGDYDVTDLAFLPEGDLLILERRFASIFGIGFRIRRIAGAAVKAGARLDGEVLVEVSLGQSVPVDNMEALLIHREGGRTFLTVLSDDNFSLFQRNLVLRFELPT